MTQAGVGYSENPDSALAGKEAAEQAIAMAGRRDACNMVLLFCTARHDQQILREVVSAVVGDSVPIYGGGTAGVMTNDAYGYAGDQVGVACLWLDGARCDVLIDGGLLESEEGTGFRLGQGLARLNVTAASPVMLFYDAIHRDEFGNVRMALATRILAGLEKALGFLPDLTGAGMLGDHVCSPTSQYIGGETGENQAMAFAFSGNIRIDSAIMHGCRPASLYYTVTKADGPVILEIDHKPALAFMDELLGSGITPEQYPFFLLLGINHGERWGEYEEDNYASRLCFGIDRERGGIVMFESDMAEGTEFQIMFRSFDLEYMKPKFESLFDKLHGRKPVFAMYIDCAGRCAGYGGTDLEDALVLQQVVGNRVPVLGLYTGVEIAPIAGRPRGLDWTGVFCLFSQDGDETPQDGRPDEKHGPAKRREARKGVHRKSVHRESAPPKNAPLDIASRLCVQNAAKVLGLDAHAISLRYELELKRRGFRLISELAVAFRRSDDHEGMFAYVARSINSSLNMQKTVMLLSDGTGVFVPSVLQGFTMEEKERLTGMPFTLPKELTGLNPTVVTGASPPELFAPLREQLGLPFFIASPVLVEGEVAALVLTGRMLECEPFFTRFGPSDVETVHAITELLCSALVHMRMRDITRKAEMDELTGLWNRNIFQRMVQDYLLNKDDNAGAFMMIDVDSFKAVNDTYGHLVGDGVLKSCANAMRSVLRDSDIIGRQGGDEFVVFCRGIKDGLAAEKKAAQLCDALRTVVPEGGKKPITASIGIVISPIHGTTFKQLYSNADAAMYKVKERGKNGYRLFGKRRVFWGVE